MKGGKDGNILIAQNGKAALLFERIHLPITDEKHMPPEGKTPLTKEELMILSAWIQAGGNLQLKMNAIAKNDSLFMLANQYQPQIGNPMNNSKRGNGMERSFDDLPNLNEYNSNYCTANYSYHGGRDIEVSFYQSKFYTHDNLIKLKNDFKNIKFY